MFGGKDKYYEYTENFWKKYLRNRSYLQKPELKVGEERQGKAATHSWPIHSCQEHAGPRPVLPGRGLLPARNGAQRTGERSSGTARNSHVAVVKTGTVGAVLTWGRGVALWAGSLVWKSQVHCAHKPCTARLPRCWPVRARPGSTPATA